MCDTKNEAVLFFFFCFVATIIIKTTQKKIEKKKIKESINSFLFLYVYDYLTMLM
jgi:hypothetical protein